MPGNYIHRFAERQLTELADGLRVVIVNGPRQSGKTTLLRMYQEQTGATYVTLDDPFQLAQARADPVTFVAQGPAPLGVVLHLGNTAGSLGHGVYALPVASLWGQRPLPPAPMP